MPSCGDYWSAVVRRPASEYLVFLSVCCSIFGVSSCLWGASYATQHADPVRFGFNEYASCFVMLFGFFFFLGISAGPGDDSMAAVLRNPGEVSVAEKLQIARIIGISLCGFGGALWGISTVFFRWFDYGSVPTPAPSPTPRPTGTTAAPPFVGPHTLLPAYALLVAVLSIGASIALAWIAIVFLQKEAQAEANADGTGA